MTRSQWVTRDTKNEDKNISDRSGNAQVGKVNHVNEIGKWNKMPTLPLEKNAASENTEKFAEFLELVTGERLGKGVRYHVVGRTVG